MSDISKGNLNENNKGSKIENNTESKMTSRKFNNKIRKDKNKNKYKLLGLVSMIILFVGSFTVTYYVINKDLNGEEVVMASSHNIEEKYDSVNIIYKTKFLANEENSQGNTTLDQSIEKFGEEKDDILSMSKEELESNFAKRNYKLESVIKNEIILLREVDKHLYKPNKYIVGIKDGFVAVLKTKENNEAYIEDMDKDITDISIENLPVADLEYLKRGREDYEFDTKEQALGFIKAIFKS